MTIKHRPPTDWKKFKGPRAILSLVISTFFGAGLFPVAPGTAGSIAALPIVYATNFLPLSTRILIWTAVFVIGVWASRVIDEVTQNPDHSSIVIDEVIGMAIAATYAGSHLSTWVTAFVLFRFFDILKPFPVRFLDQWSKKHASPWMRGFGVMIDDVAAGFLAFALISLAQFFELLP